MTPLLDTETVTVARVLEPTAPPSVPTLSSPANGATGVPIPVNLVWVASEGAASYRVQVATDPGFSAPVFDQAGITATKVTISLSPNTQYYWRVSATNPLGTSDWSQVWSFTTGTEAQDIWGPLMTIMGMALMMGMVMAIFPKEGT